RRTCKLSSAPFLPWVQGWKSALTSSGPPGPEQCPVAAASFQPRQTVGLIDGAPKRWARVSSRKTWNLLLRARGNSSFYPKVLLSAENTWPPWMSKENIFQAKVGALENEMLTGNLAQP
ncbi:hypothetical protein LEMLEM_LOCUS8889, partial [Lemmus lemmus]